MARSGVSPQPIAMPRPIDSLVMEEPARRRRQTSRMKAFRCRGERQIVGDLVENEILHQFYPRPFLDLSEYAATL